MNAFKESLKVEIGDMEKIIPLEENDKKEQKLYEQYKKDRYIKELQKPKWKGGEEK